MAKCEYCGREVVLPFVCPYCGKNFCAEHRLPESHECVNLPKKPLFWYQKAHAIREPVKTMSKPATPASHIERQPILKKSRHIGLNRRWLTSLKIWFPIFLITTGCVYVLESENPVQFYESVSIEIKYFLYAFAGFIGLWCGYEVFKRLDYEPRTERGIFGLKLLSAGVSLASFLGLFFTFYLMISGLFMKPELSLARETFTVFLCIFSLVLMVLAGYLFFKFQRRSGVIVYVR